MAFGKTDTPAPVAPAPAPVKAAPAPVARAATAATPDAPKRGRKPGQKSVPLELNLDGLVAVAVTDPQEMAKARRQRGERSTAQKKLDTMVENAWVAWKDAGRPAEWPKMPGVKIRIPEGSYETLVAGIRKAGNFYDLRVRFGKPNSSDGTVEVVFTVTDKPVKDEDDDTDVIDNES